MSALVRVVSVESKALLFFLLGVPVSILKFIDSSHKLLIIFGNFHFFIFVIFFSHRVQSLELSILGRGHIHHGLETRVLLVCLPVMALDVGKLIVFKKF